MRGSDAGPARRLRLIERVTRRFYDQFKSERARFLGFVDGIEEAPDREWYASVLLDRLMFVYFVQRKGFLDGDPHYLRNRLKRCRQLKGRDEVPSFYRHFLLRLFHEGLSSQARPKELQDLLGRIPCLNGGLFGIHPVEQRWSNIQIPDPAFERIFDCFDQYEWHLDERPLRSNNEISPDVLGFIFERYVNQKQMGAYYTRDDITGYMSRSTIIPFLFDAARNACPAAFGLPAETWGKAASDTTVWRLLQADPDRYIHPAIQHGITLDFRSQPPAQLPAPLPLPHEIQQGVDTTKPDLAGRRKDWNKPAPPDYALPTETWREVVARRRRHQELRGKLVQAQVHDINDFVTLNLDMTRFAQDVIRTANSPDLLRAFWHAIQGLSVLDPTVGSGAFLFAALKVLKPLYEACLERMEGFVADPDRSGEKPHPDRFSDFRAALERSDAPPNRDYLILKSIILNNLFGVDIMEEAVELCKLRLFLKLAAQVHPDPAKTNLGIEPLPDLDFNIRTGNTLVGYARAEEVQPAFGEGTGGPGKPLVAELNRRVAADYGVKAGDRAAYSDWLGSHLPFHWFAEFHAIAANGGFDVILGNPPYVSVRKVQKEYRVKGLSTLSCPDIYAWILERTESLLRRNGRTGMIVPLSLGFSSDFAPIRQLLFSRYGTNWFSSYGRIPSALFNFDVRVRNTIHLGCKDTRRTGTFTSRLHRWFEAARPALFQTLEYVPFQPALWSNRVPKLNTPALAKAFEHAFRTGNGALDVATSPRPTPHVLHFKRSAYNWLNFCREMPPCFEGNRRVPHTKYGDIYFPDSAICQLALLLANGKLMLIFWFAIADDFDVTRWNCASFPADFSALSDDQRRGLLALVPDLERSMQAATQFKLNAGRRVGNFNLARCRDVTDKSDRILAEALGFAEVWEDVELYYVQTVKTDFTVKDAR